MAARQKILIVEDDDDLRYLFRFTLTTAGFEVRDVSDGYEALQALTEHTPDLVVLDLGLPRVRGQSVREEMLAQAHTQHVPVVIVTGSTSAEVFQVNADCLLMKPVMPDVLVEAVRKCLTPPSDQWDRR
jgi:DNA-binding response OmpR family regulator